MIEVAMNFDEMNVAPIGIERVFIGDVELKFLTDMSKELKKDDNGITIYNALATSIVPSSEVKNIHIISKYKSTDGETYTVHERVNGIVVSVSNSYGNKMCVPSAYELQIETKDNVKYTMEVMTEIERVQKEIKELKEENKLLKNTVDKLLTGLSVISKVQ